MIQDIQTTHELESGTLLADICGINDENLQIIEKTIGCPIYSKGNQLIVDSTDDNKVKQFSILIGELKHRVSSGHGIDKTVVQNLLTTIIEHPNESTHLKNQYIVLPQGFSRVYPRSINQATFMRGLETHDMSIAIGPAGTGKTFLAIAHALSEVLAKKKRKLLLTRPVVEAGESLGFLPGDLTQKLNPYLKPLYDAMDALIPSELVSRMEENRIIEVAPLAYMRGRSLKDCYIILDEAQNTTREQMKMFLTRLGEGSKAIITGDITQIDLPKKQNSGLIQASTILRHIPEIHFTHFTTKDVVRSQLVKKIINAYDDFYKNQTGNQQ